MKNAAPRPVGCRLLEPAGHVQRLAGDVGRAFGGEEGDEAISSTLPTRPSMVMASIQVRSSPSWKPADLKP